MELLGRYSKLADQYKLPLVPVYRPVTVGQSGHRRAAPFVHKVTQRLGSDVLDQLAADYQAGIPTTQLTSKYGIGKGAVLRVLESRGVQMRHQPLTNAQIVEAIQLYDSGASLKQVGTEIGRDAETIRKALKRAGVQIRRPWERT